MQTANTRRATYEAAETGGNGAGAGGSGENNVNHNEPQLEPYLSPPPSLTTELFFANNVQRGNNQGGGNGVNQYSNFKDFMDTRPPIFKEATEPLDAEE
jgi:hypothetical protein